MSNYSTESLLVDLQRTIKHLEDSIKEKNKEIENLKVLVYKLQENIEQHDWSLTVTELPYDFPHQPPTGYRYETVSFKSNVTAIWLVSHRGFVYNNNNPTRTIWGFVKHSKKGHKYHSPINSKKVGNEVDVNTTRPYTSMPLNLNPLESVLFSWSWWLCQVEKPWGMGVFQVSRMYQYWIRCEG